MLQTEILAVQQTKDMLQNRPAYNEALSWSKIKLQDMRNQKIRTLLQYAKLNSPWYKKILFNIELENFTEDRLAEIPAMNKTTLMENWDEIVTDRRLSLALAEAHLEEKNTKGDLLYLLNQYHVVSTSGSSGKRAVFIYDWDEFNQYYAFSTRYMLHQRVTKAHAPTSNKKIKLAQVVVMNTVYLMYSLSKTFQLDNIERFYFPITLPLNLIIAGLNQV